MAEIWKPQDISVYKEWTERISVEASDELNSWESSFVDSISQRLSKNHQLTENQANKLEQIYCKYTS